jgi:hypothetical protein
MIVSKVSLSNREIIFPRGQAQPAFRESMTAQAVRYDTIRGDDLDFRMRAMPTQIETCRILLLVPYFHASTVSHFTFLTTSRSWSAMMQSRVKRLEQANSMSGIFQTEFMCECENVSVADVIDTYECTMSASASMFSISLRE